MAKTNRFQLEMEDGILVNTLRELKEYFALEKVQDYVRNGQLAEWLDARYENELADEVRALDEYGADFAEKLCKLFGVEYIAPIEEEPEIEETEEQRAKKERLIACGADQRFFDVLDSIAFSQDELYELLDEDITPVYLCGEAFEIPRNRNNISYIGVNFPTIYVNSQKVIDWNERNVSLSGVHYDDDYQNVMWNSFMEMLPPPQASPKLSSIDKFMKSITLSSEEIAALEINDFDLADMIENDRPAYFKYLFDPKDIEQCINVRTELNTINYIALRDYISSEIHRINNCVEGVTMSHGRAARPILKRKHGERFIEQVKDIITKNGLYII